MDELKQQLIDYYTNLLIVQYHSKPKAKATIELLVEEALVNNILFDIRDAFDIETAVGAQLDILGKYIGVDRNYTGQTFPADKLALIDYSETPPYDNKVGISDYSDFDTKAGSMLTYSEILSTTQILGDEDYRMLLKLKILQNNINHSHKEIDDGLFKFFGSDVIADSDGNMEMVYFVPSNASTLILVAVQKDVLPKPIGVGLDYIIENDSQLFGFSTYDFVNEQTAGLSTYADFDTKEGEMLTYNKLIEV